ncbi:hypothetical protein IV203_006544 [Nitzschia inconspicua]|uniref:Mitochondrial protein n=1 Tax=Nitzschia inconspicua TaxID=303405 RepID=A0A9K3KBH9_9STRA|nr:hypothetical protein IV203_006544 [Nitzschia inconspicua]
MNDTYVHLFGLRVGINSFEKGDHPELDTSDFLETDNVLKYQSLIGSMQWVILLGRFDIATSVMTLSSYRAVPRLGHMDHAKRIVSYLMRFKDTCIRFRTNEPDYTDLPN